MADEDPLYKVARDTMHAYGLPWTDPRTGEAIPPPDRGVLMPRSKEVTDMLTDVARSALRDHVRKAALDALSRRRKIAPTPIDNGTLPAGSPMTYYCQTCWHICDVKQEDFLFPPYKHCSECQWLIDMEWIADAAKGA
jgi:hypothetical protein